MKKLYFRGSIIHVVTVITLLVLFVITGCSLLPSRQEIMDKKQASLQADAQEKAGIQTAATNRREKDAAFANEAKRRREMSVKPALPEDVQRYQVMAESASQNKKFDTALDYYRKGLAIEPFWPQGQFQAAMLEDKLHQYGAAAIHMKRYLELAPDAKNFDDARKKMYAWEGKAKKISSKGRFIAYNDGTILDARTNLMWAARDNGKGIDWTDAKSYCENYRVGDYTDWRMPTKDELKSLYDRLIVGNSGYHLTTMINLSGCFVWASDVQGSGAKADTKVVSFLYGLRYSDPQSRTFRNRALPVRYFTGDKKEFEAVKVEEPAAPAEAVIVLKPIEPPPPPVVQEVAVKPVIIEKGRQTLDVKFDFDKATIDKHYYKNIDALAKVMQQHPDLKIIIEGHSDNIGIAEYNKKLSQKRADAIKKYIVDKYAINANRITAKGFGPKKPIASNATPEGRQKNRRVEAVVNYLIEK